MSKSYGNYIGINEPPQEIYGKVMSISDQLMWRYYELLTDVSIPEIEQMKSDAASGKQHPMELKKALARRIVQDFHGEQAAKDAGENWAKQFQKDEVPEDVEEVSVAISAIVAAQDAKEVEQLPGKTRYFPLPDLDSVLKTSSQQQVKLLRIDKLLVQAGLVESVSDGNRKLKENAVRIDSRVVKESNLLLVVLPAPIFFLRVGKRMKRIKLEG
jgi:tyrosyl-tRNA synthetase